MGGFFLVCAAPNENRADEVTRLQEAFAKLGFGAPQIIKTPGYLFAAYPKFQSRSVGLTRYPNGDFAWVCGTCLSEGVGVAASNSLYQGATAGAPIEEGVMGHFAAVFEKHGRTEIKLDRFEATIFYSLDARIVSSSFYNLLGPSSLTLTQQSATSTCSTVTTGNETLFREVKLALIQRRSPLARTG
jgi:hypothetical protein